jgi:hypothetical protein
LQHQDEEAARYATARADFDTAAVIAGEVVDLITDIPSAAVPTYKVEGFSAL